MSNSPVNALGKIPLAERLGSLRGPKAGYAGV